MTSYLVSLLNGGLRQLKSGPFSFPFFFFFFSLIYDTRYSLPKVKLCIQILNFQIFAAFCMIDKPVIFHFFFKPFYWYSCKNRSRDDRH